MTNRKKIIAMLVAILLIIGGFGYYIYHYEERADMTGQSGEISFSGTDIREEKNGQIIWSLSADTIDVDPTTQEIHLKNLKGTFHHNGVITSIVAPEAHMTKDHTNLDMTGGIHATNTEGAVFDTAALHYDNRTKQLSSVGAFSYTGKNITITGDRLVADTGLQKISVEGHAKLAKK